VQLRWGVVAVLALLAAAAPSAIVWTKGSPLSLPSVPPVARAVDFAGEDVSQDVRRLAAWIARSNDHASTNFVLIDKKFARIHVFNGEARLVGSSPVLLGGAPGDDTVPGIGDRPIAQVLPEERTTPAGRFVAERGQNARGEDVVWVSYLDALSIHRVLTTNPEERRLERLATPTPEDNRISYGCINVPAEFYENFVRRVFATHRAAVYILPEVKTLEQVFGIDGFRVSSGNEVTWKEA
jgi:hypothetical protein